MNEQIPVNRYQGYFGYICVNEEASLDTSKIQLDEREWMHIKCPTGYKLHNLC